MSGDPFNADASLIPDEDLLRLSAHGGGEIERFCQGDPDDDSCVVLARRGFGKSHVLSLRSLRHRRQPTARKTLFYPLPGHDRPPVDRLTNLHAQVPRWLEERDASHHWMRTYSAPLNRHLKTPSQVVDLQRHYDA